MRKLLHKEQEVTSCSNCLKQELETQHCGAQYKKLMQDIAEEAKPTDVYFNTLLISQIS